MVNIIKTLLENPQEFYSQGESFAKVTCSFRKPCSFFNCRMKNTLISIWNDVGRNAYSILLAIFVLWICIGVFPLICYETDSMEVILGCDIMYQRGWSLPPTFSYEYRMQPLVTIVVVALKHLMPFLSCEQIYCILAAVSSLAFLIGTIEFAHHVTRFDKSVILLAAVLLPEMYAIAMYPNSAIPAGACFIWALLLITKKKHRTAVVLLCIAPLFRVDVIVVYPVILPLFYYEGKTFRQSFLLSAIYGIIVVAVLIIGFWLLKANVLESIGGYERWNEEISTVQVLMAIFGFYSLSYFLLLPLGIYAKSTERKWKALFLVLLPIALLHFVYRSMGCASKHYLYIAPFVVIIGTWALSWIANHFRAKKVVKWTGVGIVLFFGIFSIRVIPMSKPWFEKSDRYSCGVLCPVGSIQNPSLKTFMGIGAGQVIHTLDEEMLVSGHLFYSWYIHSYKCTKERGREELKSAIATLPSFDMVSLDWGVRGLVGYMLLDANYSFTQNSDMGEDYNFTLKSGNKEINVWTISRQKKDTKEDYVKCIESIPDVTGGTNVYTMNDASKHQMFLDEYSKEGKCQKITSMLYKLNTK